MAVEPIRVLQVVRAMNRGGVETWLMHVLRRIDRPRVAIDFLVEDPQPGSYDAEILGLGSAIIRCHGHGRPLRYGRRVQSALSQHGPYQVMHSHVHLFSGYMLWLAHRTGIPTRIAHAHSVVTSAPGQNAMVRGVYRAAMRTLISRHATQGLAASGEAACSVYGRHWSRDPRWRILHCGIDLQPFARPADRLALRARLGFPAQALVVGHVGRFVEQKNHDLVIDAFSELLELHPGAHLLLVGEGVLRARIEARVAALGLSARVLFAGERDDIADLMTGAMDVFLFPSRHEGLGLALVEAQAAGLHCVVAANVPAEADLCPWLIQRLPLQAGHGAWARALAKAASADVDRPRALAAVATSSFNIETGITALVSLYGQAAAK